MTRRLGLALLSLLGSCTTTDASFECAGDDACVVAGVAGTCEPNGYCAFPDDACGSGRRFGERSPTEIAGTCVPEGDTDGSTGTSPATSGSGSGGATTGSDASTSGPVLTSSSTGDEGSESSSSTTGPQVMDGNYMFVSSEMILPSATITEDADALCTSLAESAGLPGTFVAWISTSAEDARDRLRMGNVTAQGWVRTDGLPFTNAVGDLVVGRIWYPPVLDETGAHVGAAPVMTATNGAGERTDSCADWTVLTEMDTYEVGFADGTFLRWTNAGNRGCDLPGHVYCFGVDRIEEVSFTPVPGRVAFVSDDPLPANSGVAGFDAACMASASAAGLEGTFKALVATTEAPALDRFDLSGPAWVNALGVPLTFEDVPLANVIQLDASVGYAADGSALSASVWSGAEAIGLAATNQSCQDWSTLDPAGVAQQTASNETVNWFGSSLENCDSERRVLCLED